jgi:phage terminase large subunit GpA-like protein
MMSNTFSNVAGVVDAARRALRHLVPPPRMLPSQWAEQNIRIPVGNVIPGPIRFDNAPYQRGMIDVAKQPGVRRIDYMMGAQTGKTTVIQAIVGYFVAHEPRSQILVQPSEGDVKTFVETKLRPMLDANPIISSKMAKQRSREGVNNSRIISFVGGWLMFAWAGSPKTLRGRSAPITHADEVDGMDATAEGDPVELLSQRSATFGELALSVRSSTPTIKGASRIESGFEAGDQRRFHVACHACGAAQYFRWQQVQWEGRKSTTIADATLDAGQEHKPETAHYVCEVCSAPWDDGQRIVSIRTAESAGHGWKASKPFSGHASFHGPEMLSTFRRLRDIVQSYLDKLAIDDLQSFVNVSLAETYEERGEKVEPEGLEARAEEYKTQVPAGGVYLTAGVDMQMDRLEVEVVAWGIGEESWSVDYKILWGDPLGTEVWDELEEYLQQSWTHESGRELAVQATCVDTGGTSGMTQAAYDWLRGRTGRRIFGVKGVSGWGRAIVEKMQRKQSGRKARKVDLFLVGVDEAKLVLSRRLAATLENKTGGGPGVCHFPADRNKEWYRQLTAEKLLTRYVKGQPVREWIKPDRARNEATDCRVYAHAALKIMLPNLGHLTKRMAPTPSPSKSLDPAADRARDAALTAATERPREEKPATPTDSPPNKRPSKPGKRRGGFATNW